MRVKRRIGGINYQNNTRLGAAITTRNGQTRQTRRAHAAVDRAYQTGVLTITTHGDARYAREDTREALRQAKSEGITPFCITIDRESEAELKDLYGEIGYTIIDDVLTASRTSPRHLPPPNNPTLQRHDHRLSIRMILFTE